MALLAKVELGIPRRIGVVGLSLPVDSKGLKIAVAEAKEILDLWTAIAFGLKTLGLACGTDRANSGGPPRARVCYRTAKYPLPGTYRGAIDVDRNLPAPQGCL